MMFKKVILLPLLPIALAFPVVKRSSPIKIPLHGKYKRLQSSEATVTLFDAAYAFYADIQVGTPAQNFSVLIDTGSSVLWLQGEECSVRDCPFDRYFHSLSSTAVATDYLLNVSYADGSGVFGKYYQDTISFGGLTLPDQYVGSSSTNGSLFQVVKEQEPEGLMGLGFARNITGANFSNTVYHPFVFELVKNNIIPEPIFSYSLGPPEVLANGGELVLGGVNPTKYTGDINHVPVAPQNFGNYSVYLYWQSIVQDFRISRRNKNTDCQKDILFTNSSSTYYAIMDTGTTFTYVSSVFADILYQGVTGQAQPKNDTVSDIWKIDCDFQNSTDFIQVSLTHNSDGSADTTPLKLRAPVSSFVIPIDETTCAWTILPSQQIEGVTDSQLLFGQNFLKNFYVVSNMSEPSMGFAPAINYTGQVSL